MRQVIHHEKPRYSIDLHDSGHYIIHDNVEGFGVPAGRDRSKVEELVRRVLAHPKQVGFRVADGVLSICWDYTDEPRCDWHEVIVNCN